MSVDGSVVVVGAGIAGIACARVLAAAGLPVEVLDRGRVVGGRMASRRHAGRPADIGASYLTVSDPAFEQVVRGWAETGLAHQWTDRFGVVGSRGRSTTVGPVRWGTPGGIRSLVEALAVGVTVRASTELAVGSVSTNGGRPSVTGRAVRAVVLAMPDPQAAQLLDRSVHREAAAGLRTQYEASLALTVSWDERCWEELPHGLFVNDDPVLSWIADDGRRRGDGAPVLVAHSTDAHARLHLPDPSAGARAMLEAVQRHVGIDREATRAALHRWTCAKPVAGRAEPFLLTEGGVAACGDSWASRPRVEGAWLSGTGLGHALVARLG